MRRKAFFGFLFLLAALVPAAAATAQFNPVPKAMSGAADKRADGGPRQPTGFYVYPPALKLAFEPVQAVLPAPAEPVVPQPPAKAFPRGAKRSPAHAMLAVPRFAPAFAAPDKFAVVPPKTSNWGNDRYGDCVSAQAAASLAAWSTRCLGPDKEVFATDAEVIAFAKKHGWLNGASLTEVMDVMQKSGMSVGGVTYREGSYYSVDYTKPAELQAALYVGPVNVAIDADALPSGAGNKSGWYATGKGNYPNTDHCVPLLGYGPAAYCYQQIGQPLPAALPPDKFGYILYTWNTVGFVDQDWIDSTCTEAYVRNPTTVGVGPPTPPVPPQPPTPPVPPQPPTPPIPPVPPPVPGVGFTGYLVYQNGTLTGVFAGPVPKGDVAEALRAAGVNPAVIADVLKLIADVAAKADKAVVLADLLKIAADLSLSAPVEVPLPSGSVPVLKP